MRSYTDLVEQLASSGLLDDTWARVFASVPRELFIGGWGLASPGWGESTELDRSARPDQWAEAVNSDLVIVTQVGDGTGAGVLASSSSSSSSSSMPSMVAKMLAACDIRDGHRVLEIGTGTGWNAALLCARLGDEQVVTVEIDGHVADQAQQALAAAGYRPLTLGEQGWIEQAPYDRILSTCAVTRVPYAWGRRPPPVG